MNDTDVKYSDDLAESANLAGALIQDRLVQPLFSNRKGSRVEASSFCL